MCDPHTATLRVVALRVVDRLVVAAHRAGAARILVVSEPPLPPLERAAALGITVEIMRSRPLLAGPALVLSSRALVQTPDLKRVIERQARLVTSGGTPLPVGLLNGLDDRPLDNQLAGLPLLAAEGIAEPIQSAADIPAVARILWASLTSSTDGFVDKHFNRPVGRFLSKILVHTPVSPNQVSGFATLLGLASAGLFAWGGARAALWGAIVLQVSAIVDCVDGDLARVLYKESPLGKWLDIVGDQIVHIAVFVGIGACLYRAGSPASVLWLSASAAGGVVMSFIIVLRGLLRPEPLRNTRLQKLIDATTNRDFSVVLIALVLLGKLSWFLWMTAIGVHVFWMLALGVQGFNRPDAAVHSRHERRS